MHGNPDVLHGLRRELTREIFEELAALQCEKEEILGYIGTTERKLAQWCRRVYRRTLEEMLSMIRQDGLIAIRRASFEQLKKSATVISQQYNRFLPDAGRAVRENGAEMLRAFTQAVALPESEIRALYAELPEEGGGEAEPKEEGNP